MKKGKTQTSQRLWEAGYALMLTPEDRRRPVRVEAHESQAGSESSRKQV